MVISIDFDGLVAARNVVVEWRSVTQVVAQLVVYAQYGFDEVVVEEEVEHQHHHDHHYERDKHRRYGATCCVAEAVDPLSKARSYHCK